MGQELYGLEQAEEEIATLRGQVDKLTEFLSITSVQITGTVVGVAGYLLQITETAGAPSTPPTQLTGLTAGDRALGIDIASDTNFRFRVDTNGRFDWGPGNAGTDTNLYRASASKLATDDEFAINRPTSGDVGFAVSAAGDAADRFRVLASGTAQWGDGTSAVDTNLYRSAASTLKTDDSLVVALAITATGGTAALPHVLTTDTWHTLGTLTGYTVTVGRYRLTPDNCVEIDVEVVAGGANASSVTFSVTLPAQYRPLADRRPPISTNKTVAAGDISPRLFVGSAGAVQVIQTANNGQLLGTTVRIPLD